MLINDLAAEAARIRGDLRPETMNKEFQIPQRMHTQVENIRDIKERWALRRSAKQCRQRRTTAD